MHRWGLHEAPPKRQFKEYCGIFRFGQWTFLVCMFCFFYFRPRDGSPENCFFQMSLYARAYVCIIYEKTEDKFLGEHHVVWLIEKTKLTS